MATRDTLIFSGRRWPGVRALRGNNIGRFYQFAFRVSGDGQRWDTDRPMHFWRNFPAIDLTRTDGVLRFIARHGDPFGDRNHQPIGTNAPWWHGAVSWHGVLRTALGDIAQAWEPLDPNGISFFSDDRDRLQVAVRALHKLAPPDEGGLPDIELIAQGRDLVKRATTLQAFMIASAASALRHGITMKRCAYAHCGDWFELRRADAIYCSGSCQAADYKQRAMAQGATVVEIASRKRKGRFHGKRA